MQTFPMESSTLWTSLGGTEVFPMLLKLARKLKLHHTGKHHKQPVMQKEVNTRGEYGCSYGHPVHTYKLQLNGLSQ